MAISASRMPQNQSQCIYFSQIFLGGGGGGGGGHASMPNFRVFPFKLKILYEPLVGGVRGSQVYTCTQVTSHDMQVILESEETWNVA